jgi:hypothetical protein
MRNTNGAVAQGPFAIESEVNGLRDRPMRRGFERRSGHSVGTGRFTATEQAMGTPRGRDGLGYLRKFLEEAKCSGFVAAALQWHGQRDAVVAPCPKGLTGRTSAVSHWQSH